MAYTKYSLTPSSNTAAPPDGAPEGMLPSAVNDTMRDMMAQIRDCGDGIRDGTYTMTAPKITGGTITGSTINNSAIGGTTAAAGAFTTLSATGVTTVQAGTVSLPAITTTGDTNTGIFFPAADTIAFAEGGTESMRITSTGTVAIGTTTTPTAKLWVESGRVGLTNAYKLGWHSNPAHGDLANYITGDDNSNYVALGTGGTERMRIDSSGNVLVGATSAVNSSKFLIAGVSGSSPVIQGASSAGAYLRFYNNAQTTGDLQIGQGFGSGSDNVGILLNNANEPIVIGTNGTERMRITSSGELCIGTTTAIGTSVLAISASTSSKNILTIKDTGTTYGAGYRYVQFYNSSDAVAGSIDHTLVTTVNYNTSSDQRLKIDEGIATDTSVVDNIKIHNFIWKQDGKKDVGLFAQEAFEIKPSAISEGKDDLTEDGNIAEPWCVDYSKFVPDLIVHAQQLKKIVQEQQTIIENLTTRLNALEGK